MGSDNFSCNRVFLDWNKPFLDSACEWLISLNKSKSHLDLSKLTVLSTVSRASRHLTEKLLWKSELLGLGLSPPNFISISSLFQAILPDKRIPTSLESTLIFFDLLKGCDHNLRLGLFPSLKNENQSKLFEKAIFLSKTYQEFTKNGETSDSSLERILNSGLISEQERWQSLKKLFSLYKNELNNRNLVDTQSCLEFLESPNYSAKEDIILLACYDLAPILKKTIKAGYQEITSLIFAANEVADGFDEIGTIIPEYWKSKGNSLNLNQIKICENSVEQANCVFEDLSEIQNAAISANQVTIGALEPGTEKIFQIVGSNYLLPIHLPNSNLLKNSEEIKLAKLAINYQLSKSFSDLAKLLSFDKIQKSLSDFRNSQILVNRYREEALQVQTLEQLPDCPAELKALLKKINDLVDKFPASDAPISEWSEAFLKFLAAIYENEKSENLQLIFETFKKIEHNKLTEVVNASVFLELLDYFLAETEAEEGFEQKEGSTDTIDVVGWLELALDDSEYTFITSFNEKFVPAEASPNIFLPQSIRTFLSLEDNQYKFARDNYIVHTFLASKKKLNFYCSRKSLDQSPLLPSRLLLNSAPEINANIIEHFYLAKTKDSGLKTFSSTTNFKASYAKSLIPLTEKPRETITTSVSAINDYIRCPYYYYLKHVLELKEAKPDSRELSGSQFGSLLHDLIARFSHTEISESLSEQEIEKNLLFQLEKVFFRTYGKKPFPEVLIQYHQLTHRIKNYAKWQIDWRNKGWKIWKIELAFEEPGLEIITDAGRGYIKGRIDRIDYHPSNNQYAIIDFKTGEKNKGITGTYSKKHGWLDIQLPTYYFYATKTLNLENPKPGILPIAASSEDLAMSFSDWESSEYDQAEEAIKAAITGILKQNYWPPKLLPEKAFEFEDIYRAHL